MNNPTPKFAGLGEDELHKHIYKLLEDANISYENLTRNQFAEAIRQMLAAGDFVKYIVKVPPTRLDHVAWNGTAILPDSMKLQLEERSMVVYEPLREVEQLRAENQRLRERLQIYEKPVWNDPL